MKCYTANSQMAHRYHKLWFFREPRFASYIGGRNSMVGRICLILDGKHLIIIIETTTLSLREREGAEWVLRAPSSLSPYSTLVIPLGVIYK